MILKKTIMAIFLSAIATITAQAGPIIGAVGATVDIGGTGNIYSEIQYSHNGFGLNDPYFVGQDFDTYIASAPTHRAEGNYIEWQTPLFTTQAQVTYDLGSLLYIDAIALWNADVLGIGPFNLLGSTDGLTFFNLALGLIATPHPDSVDYLADVFSFSSSNLRYVRFDMYDCPDWFGVFQGCAIGEVAFRTADSGGQNGNGQDVPEPAPLALLGLGLLGLGLSRKRRA